jgi:hypothetical protein
MANVGLDRLLREEEALADLAVYEPIGDQLEDFDLPRGRVLSELALDLRRERDDGAVAAGTTTRCSRLEAAAVVPIPIENLLTLGGVHASGIGAPVSSL